MCWTSLFEPLGMTKSTQSSSLSSCDISLLDSTSATISLLTFPPVASSTASPIALCRALLLSLASLPPFKRRPLPEAMLREAIWGRESGRDSKIIIRTPMGQVTSFRVRPEASSVTLLMTPRGSSDSAICLIPVERVSSFPGVSLRRLRSCESRPCLAAFSRSTALACMTLETMAESARLADIFRRTADLSDFPRAVSFLASSLALRAFLLPSSSSPPSAFSTSTNF
mmetsp:Transcript_18108/g.33634  ORF Transcript_18108/g.33634 Transcript_18108/m.33634 type:complete len:227 (-) Transcript_18108:1146-1826(-)